MAGRQFDRADDVVNACESDMDVSDELDSTDPRFNRPSSSQFIDKQRDAFILAVLNSLGSEWRWLFRQARLQPQTDIINTQRLEIRTSRVEYLRQISGISGKTFLDYAGHINDFVNYCRRRWHLRRVIVNEDLLYTYLVDKAFNFSTAGVATAAITKLAEIQAGLKFREVRYPRSPQVIDMMKNLKSNRAAYNRSRPAAETAVGGYNLAEARLIMQNTLLSNDEILIRGRLLFLLGESAGHDIRRAEFADMAYFKSEITTDPTPFNTYIMITGKTNRHGDKEHYSLIRHKEPEVCAISALTFYLFYRFHIKREDPPDFTYRKNWHCIKLIRTFPGSRDDSIAATTYRSDFRKIRQLTPQIATKAVTHLPGLGPGIPSDADFPSDADGQDLELQTFGQCSPMAITRCNELGACAILRKLAGFNPAGGSYYLPRATADFGDMKKQIFPFIDGWLDKIYAATGSSNANRPSEEDLETGRINPTDFQYDRTVKIFLEILKSFRDVILQDASILIEKYPDLIIFEHPIFQSAEFKDKAKLVREAHQTERPIAESPPALRSIIPVVVDTIERQTEAINNGVQTILRDTDEKYSSLEAVLRGQDELLHQILQGQNELKRGQNELKQGQNELMQRVRVIESLIGKNVRSEREVVQNVIQFVSNNISHGAPGAYTPAAANVADIADGPTTPTIVNGNADTAAAVPAATAAAAVPAAAAAAAAAAAPSAPTPAATAPATTLAVSPSPITSDSTAFIHEVLNPNGVISTIHDNAASSIQSYTMEQDLQTVEEAWQEWFHGMKGQPSIHYMETTYPNGEWRQRIKQNFNRRRRIIEEVQKVIKAGYSEDAAISIADQFRCQLPKIIRENSQFNKVRDGNSTSLDKLRMVIDSHRQKHKSNQESEPVLFLAFTSNTN